MWSTRTESKSGIILFHCHCLSPIQGDNGQSQECRGLAGAVTLAIFPAIPLQVRSDNFSKDEEANVNISLSTVVPSTELLEERAVPMGQPDGVPVVVGYADDEDEEDEDEVDDLDDDEDEEDDLDDDDDDFDDDFDDDDEDDDEDEDEGEDEEE